MTTLTTTPAMPAPRTVSDAGIRADVGALLSTVPGDLARDVRVDVRNRTVVLHGGVEDRVTGEWIAHAVARVYGVASVVNVIAYGRDSVTPDGAPAGRERWACLPLCAP